MDQVWAGLICVPYVLMNMFTLSSARWRYTGAAITIAGLIALSNFDSRFVGPSIVAFTWSFLLVWGRQWLAVSSDVEWRWANDLPPLMKDRADWNLWFNPIWFLRYRYKMHRDPAYLELLADRSNFYDVLRMGKFFRTKQAAGDGLWSWATSRHERRKRRR